MSSRAPSDAILEKALRDVVRDTFRRGDTDNITVKRIRIATEERLHMQHDFFKNDDVWKTRSKEVIEEEAIQVKSAQHEAPPDNAEVELETESLGSEAIESSPVKPLAKPRKPTATSASRTNKKRKAETDLLESPEAKKVKSTTKTQKGRKKAPLANTRIAADSEGEELSEMSTPSITEEPPAPSIQAKSPPLDDESELSDLVDDSPKPKSKKSRKDPKGDSSKAKPKPEKKNKVAKDKSPEDPDTERIKSLQGWLLKCGIRKVWGSYLKPYNTPKAKIKHLESMLNDVGMTGRFSLEKASQIKEKRELAADLEAVQEGEKKWGKLDSEEDGGRPKRRLAKGFQGLDFLDDDDGEETD